MESQYYPSCISSFVRGGGGGGGGVGEDFVLAVQYGMFRVYAYFCNLVIYRVIINTLLCIPISMTVKI